MRKDLNPISFMTSADYKRSYDVFVEYGKMSSYVSEICEWAERNGIDLTSEEVISLSYEELEIRELVELSQITLNALNEEIQIYLENKKESEGK
jgi:hypothetical protein